MVNIAILMMNKRMKTGCVPVGLAPRTSIAVVAVAWRCYEGMDSSQNCSVLAEQGNVWCPRVKTCNCWWGKGLVSGRPEGARWKFVVDDQGKNLIPQPQMITTCE